jgi:pentatricopeptide repeat domain-containing protein 1
LKLFDEYKQTGAALNVEIYTAAVTACSYSKQLDLAFCLFREMKAASVQPDVVTYTALIQACNICKQWQQAVAVYEQLAHDANVQPNRLTYSEALRAYKQLGDTDRVAELTSLMQQLQ